MDANGSVFFAAMTIAIVLMLFQLLRSTQAVAPFPKRNVTRINTIALIVGLAATLVHRAQGVADNAILTSGRLPDSSAATPIRFELSFILFALMAMLVLALIGEAFRRGVELRGDVEGLV